MRVKKYVGGSLEKIREVIVKELGENAVIVNIKEQAASKGSLLSIGKKGGFEVIAAVEDALNVDQMPPEKGGSKIDEFLVTQKEQYRGLRNSIKMLDEKIAEVDEKMDTFSTKISTVSDCRVKELLNVHEEWRSVVSEALNKIIKSQAEPTEEDWHEALASIVPTAGGIMFRRTPSAPADVYVLAGPTGVGKTTTLAKLAAKCVLNERLNVGLITIDTFRIGAIDQLREYSSLLGVEIAVAFSPEELKQQIKQFYEKDVIFIDTPGRSQFDKAGIKKIKECISGIAGLCVLMVASANVRKEDAISIYENYKELNPAALIISKTDEASCCDGITKLLDVSHLPVVYLTDGQRVPEDIHVASPGIVASLVMPFVKCNEQVKIGDIVNG